ncbi:ABC transporter permease [Pediococcus acidilactici]|uniref:ABC transporter permease n=1 Tax=Pediococcus acidilactici TaxID=1254 RepID=UPI00194E5669|nr:ABC transporter permease [Pediococcus acidilactici]MBM6586265.1 ABC transporter permease [Pediococcus acidilactici]
MLFSVRQELYKLVRRKIFWVAPIVMFVLMIVLGYTVGVEETKFLSVSCFGFSEVSPLILIIVGSTLFSMEFQNNTILTLLYKAKSKIYVYLSKFFVIFMYDVFLHILAIVFTLILRSVILKQVPSWTMIYEYHQPLWQNMLIATLIDLIFTLLVISTLFLLSSAISNNALVLCLSIAVIFFGKYVSVQLMRIKDFIHILRWNPFNMANLVGQYYHYDEYSRMSHLSVFQLSAGSLIYIALFLGVGYLIFTKKRF